MRYRRGILGATCAVLLAGTAVRAAAQPPPTPEPPANVTSTGMIAPANEPGDRLIVTGQLTGPDGSPAANVIVYAYQTDATGDYHNRDRLARLHGWAKTGRDGRFEFRTIRPGAYPGRTIAAHIHLHAWGGGYPLQWTQDVKFSDDPLLTAKDRDESKSLGEGFQNICAVTREASGAWHCAIRLRLSRETNYPAQYRDDPRTRP